MAPSSQHIVNEANKQIEHVILIKVLQVVGSDKERGKAWYEAVQELREQLRIIRHVAATAEKIPLMAVACDIELGSLERGTWPKWGAILTGDITHQPNHPWLQVGTQGNAASAVETTKETSSSAPEQDIEMEDAVAQHHIPEVAAGTSSGKRKGKGKRKEQEHYDTEEDDTSRRRKQESPTDDEGSVQRGRSRDRRAKGKEPKRGRSRAKSIAPPATVDDEDQYAKTKEPHATHGRNRAKSIAPSATADEGDQCAKTKEPKRGRSRAKSIAPSAPADDASPHLKGPCVACSRRDMACTPIAGKACKQCNSRKVRCSFLPPKRSRSASLARESSSLPIPVAPEPIKAPAKKESQQSKATVPQKPAAPARPRSKSVARREDSPSETSEVQNPVQVPPIMLKIAPTKKRVRDTSPEEMSVPRKSQKFAAVPKLPPIKGPIAPSTIPGLMKGYADLKAENAGLKSRIEVMERAMVTFGEVLESMKKQDEVSPNRDPSTGGSAQLSVNRLYASLPPSSSITTSPLPHSSTSPSPAPLQSTLLAAGSATESPLRSASPISPLGAQDSVPQIVLSLPEMEFGIAGEQSTAGPSGAEGVEDPSATDKPVGGSFPPPVFPSQCDGQ